MSDRPTAAAPPAEQSIGGAAGHWFRRGIHVGMSAFPWLYYWHGEALAAAANTPIDLGWTPQRLGAALVLALLGLEALRLTLGWRLPGYRRYEGRRLSAMAWGTLSVGLTLLVVPQYGVQGAALGLPLVLCLSLGDPLMGELRARAGFNWAQSALAGWALMVVISLTCAFWLGTPWWFVLLVPLVSIAAEKPDLDWMDDNGSMLLAPLALVLLLSHWL